MKKNDEKNIHNFNGKINVVLSIKIFKTIKIKRKIII
jgi:hypothetical protein